MLNELKAGEITLAALMLAGTMICLTEAEALFNPKYAMNPPAQVTTQKVAEDNRIHKMTGFYMAQNERVWYALAEYQAVATIQAAKKHEVDEGLIAGVVATESEGYPFAISPTGAAGSGQVDFKAHEGRFPEIREVRDKFDPAKNIDCAAELLSEYTGKYGLKNGLQVYNIGTGAFASGKRNPKYTTKVLKKMKEYRQS